MSLFPGVSVVEIGIGMGVARLTSLLLVEERLREAVYWAELLRNQRGDDFTYHLNAFLSSARSVTFLLQKEMSDVTGFSPWWEERQNEMRVDAGMRFFLRLRNFSQKQGRVSVVGGSAFGPSRGCWVYGFRGDDVPVVLRDRNVADCCLEHTSKLETLVLECMARFPSRTCYARSMRLEYLGELPIGLDDIDEALGFPRGYTNVPGVTVEDRLELFARSFDAVDVSWLEGRAAFKGDSQHLDAFLKGLLRY